MRFRPFLPLALALAAAALPSLRSGRAAAQNSPQMSPAAAIPQWRSFVGANPLGIPFDIVSIEGETVVSGAMTAGLVASYNDIDSKRYTTADVRFKYYPAETAMRGFSVGLSGGMTKFRTEDSSNCTGFPATCTTTFKNLNAGTIGVLVDYNWTQGPSQRFVVGTGVGAKRIIATEDDRNRLGLDKAYATARFVIGLLF